MRILELTWPKGEWAEGVAEGLAETILDALESAGRVLPDEWRVLEVHEDGVVSPDV